jgi:TP901 family phage tail tape measure protein
MAQEQEIARLIVRLVGENERYLRSLTSAARATDKFTRDAQGRLRNFAGQFAREFGRIDASVDLTRQKLIRGAQITQQTATAREKYARELIELSNLHKVGAITLQVYNRALRASTADYLKAGNAASQYGRRLRDVGTQMMHLGRSMTFRVTLPIVGLGAAAVREFSAFEFELNKMRGLVGVSEATVREFSDAILDMAGELGRAPVELASAGYFILSSGVTDTARAMDVLKVSGQAASAGLGTTAQVADVLTSAMNAYGFANMSAAKAAGILIATVREGKGEVDDFTTSIGKMLPVAAQMDISFEEAGAALAVMTRVGTPAATAAVYLRQVLRDIQDPAKEAEQALQDLAGHGFAEVRKQIREEGLIKALVRLNAEVRHTETGIAQIFGEARSMSGVLDLLGKNIAETVAVAEEMKDTSDALRFAFEEAAKTTKFKLSQATAELKAALIDLGRIITPIVLEITKVFRSWLSSWRHLSDSTKKTIATVLAFTAALGPLLTIIGGFAKAIALATIALNTYRIAVNVATAATWALNASLIATRAGLIALGAVALVGLLFGLKEIFEELTGINDALSRQKELFDAVDKAQAGQVGKFLERIKDLPVEEQITEVESEIKRRREETGRYYKSIEKNEKELQALREKGIGPGFMGIRAPIEQRFFDLETTLAMQRQAQESNRIALGHLATAETELIARRNAEQARLEQERVDDLKRINEEALADFDKYLEGLKREHHELGEELGGFSKEHIEFNRQMMLLTSAMQESLGPYHTWSEENKRLLDSLYEEARALGMQTEALRKSAEALRKSKEAAEDRLKTIEKQVEEEKREREQLMKRGEDLKQQLDPIRKYKAELEDLRKLFEVGAIDRKTFEMAGKKAQEDALDALRQQRGAGKALAAREAVGLRTAEAASRLQEFRATLARTPEENRETKALEAIREKATRQVELLEKIAEQAAQGQQLVPLDLNVGNLFG